MMDLVSKYDLIEKIVQTDDEGLQQQSKNLLVKGKFELLDNMGQLLKASLKKGLTQSAKGKVTAQSDVMKKVKKRLNK
jgi:hypothetical protein